MFYKPFIRPILFQLDSEFVHNTVHTLGHGLALLPGSLAVATALYADKNHPELSQTQFGMTFTNPVGLAAGFDKNIGLIRVLKALGFGYAEVGSISARPATGNPKPRLYRIPKDKALLNRMGLNNDGVAALLPKIQQFSADWPVGISVVKTHDPTILGAAGLDDFAETLRQIHGYGAYVSINISCPNTEEGKTFEDPEALASLLTRLRQVEAECTAQCGMSGRPWCLKISPDLEQSQLQELFEIACRHQIAGWVACNTTSRRSGMRTPALKIGQMGRGGISGQPLQHLSTRVLGSLYQLAKAQNTEMVLMGVGGVHDTASAWEKITHGASLLQLYTGLIYEGPGLIREIQTGLLAKLQENNMRHLQEAVGSAFR